MIRTIKMTAVAAALLLSVGAMAQTSTMPDSTATNPDGTGVTTTNTGKTTTHKMRKHKAKKSMSTVKPAPNNDNKDKSP